MDPRLRGDDNMPSPKENLPTNMTCTPEAQMLSLPLAFPPAQLYDTAMRWTKPSASAVFVILMVLSCLALFLPPAWANTPRAAVNSLLAPSSAGINRLLHYFSSLPEPPAQYVSPERYRLLCDRLAQLERQTAFLHNQWMAAVDEFARAQHLKRSALLKSYSLIPAKVYGSGPPGKAILLIDQGSTSGLEKGLWVVGFPEESPAPPGRAALEASVLLGRLGSVQARTAQVHLLGDPDQPPLTACLYRRIPGRDDFQSSAIGPVLHVQSAPGAKLKASDVPKERSLDSDEDLKDLLGAFVVSVSGKNLPTGLAIGRVVRAATSPRSLAFFDLTIEPLANGATVSSVMVLRPLPSAR